MNKLGSNLKLLLQKAHLSENELARRTGISQQIINRILSGENKNPKIATLNPIANYFMISISQLIGDEFFDKEVSLNILHRGWREIPLIDFNNILGSALNELILESNSKVIADIDYSENIFALKMNDDSMEPKFSKGSILIFDSKREVLTGDYGLLIIDKKILIRQVFLKNEKFYVKSLNPNCDNYKITMIDVPYKCLGVLLQSITHHIE